MFAVPRNTVKFRGSPAAVILACCYKLGHLLSKLRHCFVLTIWEGRLKDRKARRPTVTFVWEPNGKWNPHRPLIEVGAGFLLQGCNITIPNLSDFKI
jgi:hypothetical protein